MYLIDPSSIKEFLFDVNQSDAYDVLKMNTKRDCINVGNEYSYYPYPSASFDTESLNTYHQTNSHNMVAGQRGKGAKSSIG